MAVGAQAVDHSLGSYKQAPIIQITCTDGDGGVYRGSHYGILWGIPIKGSTDRYWVEAAVRWDDEPAVEQLWNAVKGGSFTAGVPDFIQKALTHKAVYIRIVERLGAGDKHYAKFEFEGLADVLGDHRAFCLANP